MSILNQAESIADITYPHSALFYGKSGTGKTTLAATYPKPILFLDIGEKGTGSIKDVDDIDRLTIDSWSKYTEAILALRKDNTYTTIVVDSVHALNELAIKEAQRTSSKNNRQITQNDYLVASQLMKTWLVDTRDLTDRSYHVVFLAHDRRSTENDSTGENVLEPTVGPRLGPSVSSTLVGACNIVGYTFIRAKGKKLKGEQTIEYCLRIGPHGVYETKVRADFSKDVPSIIIDPTFNDLEDLLD